MSLDNLWDSVTEFHKHWGTSDIKGQKRVLWEEYGEYLYELYSGVNEEDLIEEAVDMIVVAMGLIFLSGEQYSFKNRYIYTDPCAALFLHKDDTLVLLCNNIIYNHFSKYGNNDIFDKVINKVIEKNSKKRRENGYILNKNNKVVKG